MTLSELRYLVAVAQARHFGRAADRCFVSQPTLSVAIRKLEDELGVQLIERGGNEVTLTSIGEQVVEQAQRVLEESQRIKAIVEQGRDPLVGPLRMGTIYTVGPYLLPTLVPALRRAAPHMPLILQENYTARLLESLRRGELDVIILASPFDESGLNVIPLYDEPFYVAMAPDHAWTSRAVIDTAELTEQTVLLLSSGNCFRDQILAACPALSNGQRDHPWQKTLEGSSLDTIRYMVASGIGITVLPASAAMLDRTLVSKPLREPTPSRRIVLASRKRFARASVLPVLQQTLSQLKLPGTTPIEH